MADGVNALANLLGKVNSNNALVVTLDGGVASATLFLGGDGTEGAPTFSFTSDATNGMYLSAADTLGWSAGGTLRLSLSTTAVTSTVPLLAPNGLATAASFAFESETNTGMFRLAADYIGFSLTDTTVFAIRLNGVELRGDGELGWANGSIGGGIDVFLKRLAADVIGVGTGDAYGLASKFAINTAPTIASGFGTSPSIAASNGTAAFTVNVGTGGSATAGVITMPAATTGWIAHVENITRTLANGADQRTVQIASSTTTITVENQTISTGAVLAWTASDVLVITAVAY